MIEIVLPGISRRRFPVPEFMIPTYGMTFEDTRVHYSTDESQFRPLWKGRLRQEFLWRYLAREAGERVLIDGIQHLIHVVLLLSS